MNYVFRNYFWIPLCFAGIFLVTVLLRPLLPIDETRYVTVAWEMLLRHDWLAPLTMNGQPYHHKPPLLFWLINSVWIVTGPSRWAATIPPVLMGIASVFLTMRLGQRLFDRDTQIATRVSLIMMSSVLFLLYASMIMFDVTMTFFVLVTLLALLSFSRTQEYRYVLLMALMLGLGVLTKGPVAYLYTIFPMLLGPVWHRAPVPALKWYGGCLLALLLSFIPVLLWLVPVLRQSDGHFAFWLVWEQTAGRVTGNFNDAHVRPFYSYIPVVLVLMLPWIFFPKFWYQARKIRMRARSDDGIRFIMCWLVPVFISFSIINGKQPHYLVPLIPGLALFLTIMLRDLKIVTLRRTMATIFLLFVLSHIVGAMTFLKSYDLMPIADYIAGHQDHDWAYVKNYHGELTFLARMEKPMDVEQPDTIDTWFRDHPAGYAIIRFSNADHFNNLDMVMDIPYRGKRMGIFRLPDHNNHGRLKADAPKAGLDRYFAGGGQSMVWLLYAYVLQNARGI